jgi:ketosteroid isomerase-like protein
MTNSGAANGALLILLAVSCGHAQQPQKQAASARGDALRDEIVAQERAGLDALKTGDMTAFANSTADDAIFVDAAGPAGKAEVLKNTANFRLTDYTMSDIRFVRLSRDSGLIVYRLAESGTSHGKEFTGKVNGSSLWLKRAGKWVCLFSQETGAK